MSQAKLIQSIALSCLLFPAALAKSEEPRERESHLYEIGVKTKGLYSVPITVFGKAIDSHGIPITGAEIFLASPWTDEEPLAIAKTDEVGAYRFESVLLPIISAFTNDSVDVGALALFGRADGFGFSGRQIERFYPNWAHRVGAPWVGPGYGPPKGFGRDDPIELNLTFGPPASLRGRVVDDRGEPIAETVVVIRNAHYWGDDYPRREYESNWLFVPKSVKTLTDEFGRFVFGTLPANHVFKLDVCPPGNPPRMIYGATRDGVESCHGRRVYSGDFDVIFAQPRKVKFHVVYGDTGKPAPKVGVGGREFKAGFWVTTDVDGHVETPLPDGQYQISMSPRFGTPYLETKVNVIVSAETSTKPIKLELRPAAVIDITVVDADTREPLSGVDVWWWRDRRIPGIVPTRTVRYYRSWEVETRISHYERPRSDESGKMRVLFDPGKHRIGVGLRSFPKGYKPVNRNGKYIECQSGEAISVEFHMRNPMNGDPAKK